MLLPLHIVLTLVVAFLPLCLSLPSLQEKFYTYAILSPRHIEVRVKKDTRGRIHSKAMRLPLFGRKLSLLFKPGSLGGILTPDASLHAVHANGTESPIHLDPADFHQGVIRGYTNSWVSGVYHCGLWAIQARHPALSFSVEPLVFHTGESDAMHRMVAYRHSDVRPRNGVDRQTRNKTDASFCTPFESTDQYKNLKSSFEYAIHQKQRRKAKNSSLEINNTVRNGGENTAYHTSRRNRFNTKAKQRNKRDSSPHMICDMLAISDYYLYKHYAGESVNRVARVLVQAYQMADRIFSHTDFGVDFSVGLRIRRMKVLTSDDGMGIGSSFNAMNDEQNALDLIKTFTKLPYARQYCHAHLTSGRSFKGNTLGLAYTAVRRRVPPVGICGGQQKLSFNVAVTTFRMMKFIVPLSEYGIILTHEIGHSFGALHDTPDGPAECRPKEVQGGLYLMWPSANQGYGKHNDMFSPCSKRQIKETLMHRSQCLIPLEQMEQNLCGNGILDYGEDCDAGFTNFDDPHGCCTHKCRFTPHAICSPYNHPCCQKCTVAPPSQTCVNALEEHDCMEPAHCDGVQFHSCPSSRAKLNGQLCRNHGECQNGDCVSYCSLFGQRLEPPELFVPCACEKNRKDMCSLCCRKMVFNKSLNEMECRPHNKTYDDSRQCMMGTCKKGYCVKTKLLDGQDTLAFSLTDKKEGDSNKSHYVEYGCLIVGSTIIFVLHTVVTRYHCRRVNKGNDISSTSTESATNSQLAKDSTPSASPRTNVSDYV